MNWWRTREMTWGFAIRSINCTFFLQIDNRSFNFLYMNGDFFLGKKSWRSPLNYKTNFSKAKALQLPNTPWSPKLNPFVFLTNNEFNDEKHHEHYMFKYHIKNAHPCFFKQLKPKKFTSNNGRCIWIVACKCWVLYIESSI
jgi:hypothetical protein